MADLFYAGQHQLDAVEILQSGGISLDIKPHVSQLTIYEDMFSPFMTGNIITNDTVDIMNMLGQQGDDMLHIKVYTPDIDKKNYIDKYFHIYKVSDRTDLGDRRISHVIHFGSVDMLTESSMRISKTYKDLPHKIIENILNSEIETDVDFNSDKTINTVQYTSNYWTPVKNITYLTDHAVGTDGLPSFSFYENRYGYQFRQLTGFASDGVKPINSFSTSNFNAEVKSTGTETGAIVKDLNIDYKTVLDMRQPLHFDYYKDLQSGMLNSRLQYYDLVTKKRYVITFDMNDETHPLLNPQRFYKDRIADNSYSDDDGSIFISGESVYGLYNGATDTTNLKFVQKRNSILRQLQSYRVEIDVFGRTDYTVGSKVTLGANKIRRFDKGSSEKEIQDPMVTGNYIISAICHRFTTDKHVATLELIKDSILKV